MKDFVWECISESTSLILLYCSSQQDDYKGLLTMFALKHSHLHPLPVHNAVCSPLMVQTHELQALEELKISQTGENTLTWFSKSFQAIPGVMTVKRCYLQEWSPETGHGRLVGSKGSLIKIVLVKLSSLMSRVNLHEKESESGCFPPTIKMWSSLQIPLTHSRFLSSEKGITTFL